MDIWMSYQMTHKTIIVFSGPILNFEKNECTYLLAKIFMPPDPADRNNRMMLSCSKIRYNEKKFTFFEFFYAFRAIFKQWRVIAKNR